MRIQDITRELPTAVLMAATAGALVINSPVAQALAPLLLAATILWRGKLRPPMRGGYSAAVRRAGRSMPRL